MELVLITAPLTLFLGIFVGRFSAKRRKPHKHRWGYWHGKLDTKWHRTCRCGAIQRHNTSTGEISIWEPDGIQSGLLDKGLSRKIYEELDK